MSYAEVVNNLELAMRRYKDVTHHVSCIVDINILKETLDLINRQQAIIEKSEKVEHFADKTIETANAEIERLQSMCQTLSECRDEVLKAGVKAVRNVKSEAIKEFAEKLKNCFAISGDYLDIINIIDNLVKEKTEVEINQRKED